MQRTPHEVYYIQLSLALDDSIVRCQEDLLYTYTGVGLSALLVSTYRAMRRPIDRGTSDRMALRFFFLCIQNINQSNNTEWSCCSNGNGMRLEKWFISKLNDSQRKIIVQSIDEDIIVQGAAGSGKTNLAIHRALQAKNKGSYAIVIFTVALKRMIAYGMQALGLDKERIAYEWAWTHRGFDLTGDVF